MRLPVLLEPWRAWLALFPADLAEPLGEMLLRLHPLVGRLGSATSRPDDLPAGVGNIVQRGSYERMLLTEWAYADAVPDEFLRRAASGELLFTGPEPAGRQRSRRSVVLFDAGPAQLGEPRLAHLALFILLTRRAQEAGAEFLWGILQKPAALDKREGREGLQALLRSRTLNAPGAADADAWEKALGADVDDCWLVGATAHVAPRQVRAVVCVNQALLGNRLEVALTQRRGTRNLSLELPPVDDGIRLLRQPFEPLVPYGVLRQRAGRPSLKQPPRFGVAGYGLAVAQVDGGTMIYPLPQSARQKIGKGRSVPARLGGNFIAVGVFSKSLSSVASDAGSLEFRGFPGPLFGQGLVQAPRPETTHFRAPPGLGRWLSLFFLRSKALERVVVLDVAKNLVAWERAAGQGASAPLRFRTVMGNVLGATQYGDALFFGCAEDGVTRIYRWNPQAQEPQQIARIASDGSALLLGGGRQWRAQHLEGLFAVQRTETDWWVGTVNEAAVTVVADGASVLGVVRSRLCPEPGLVVLHPGKRRIELRSGLERFPLVVSEQPIGQACCDPDSGRLAWIGGIDHALTVREIDGETPLLRVVMDGDADAS
ncbi:hypothetical protein LPN04_14960 [Rugamonas sp. A1-17]|nr:hypothetical protein [Rugamonas sp. A1-17]